MKVTWEALRKDRELYFRSCLRIRPKEGESLVPFVMRDPQRRLIEAIEHERRRGRPPRIIILKSRQVGFSTLSQAEIFRTAHTKSNRMALVVAHKAESAVTLFDMSRRFYDNLPKAVQPKLKYNAKRILHFKDNDSSIQVEVAGESRGFMAQLLHVSEFAFVPKQQELLTAILQTVPRTKESLVIIESTPNGVGDVFHEMWVKAKRGKSSWVPFFVPWFEEPTYQLDDDQHKLRVEDLSERDAAMMRTYNLSLGQMAWYVKVREDDCNGDQDVMDQEYPTDDQSCFLASGRKVFDTEGLRHYIEVSETVSRENPAKDVELDWNPADKRGPTIREVKGGRWNIYEKPIPRHMYIAAADISSGDPGADPTPIVIGNQHTLGLAAEFYSRTPPDLLWRQAQTAGYWYNTAKMAPEANNHGILFIHEMMRDQYPNVYYRRVNEDSVAGKVSDKPGVWTSGSTREALYNLGRRFVRERSGIVHSLRMVKEWASLHYDEQDRVDHPKGEHDDLAMAWNLFLYVHAGGYDHTLEPLPLSVVSRAPDLYREVRSRQAMGQSIDDIDLGGMTMEEIEQYDALEARRLEARMRTGLEGQV